MMIQKKHFLAFIALVLALASLMAESVQFVPAQSSGVVVIIIQDDGPQSASDALPKPAEVRRWTVKDWAKAGGLAIIAVLVERGIEVLVRQLER